MRDAVADPLATGRLKSPWMWNVLVLILSCVASAGSLYLSIGLGLKACPLCFYQRSFAIAALLVQDAPLALLDEPSSHLDIAQQAAALALFVQLARERQGALVMVLHDLHLATRFCDHAIAIGGGEAHAGRAEAGSAARDDRPLPQVRGRLPAAPAVRAARAGGRGGRGPGARLSHGVSAGGRAPSRSSPGAPAVRRGPLRGGAGSPGCRCPSG